MQTDWVRHLLLVYGALAISTILSLFLWISSRIEGHGQSRRESGARRQLEAEVAALRCELDTVREGLVVVEGSLAEVRETSGALVPPAPPRSGLNLSTRSQVLRRNRFGEPAGDIAAALGVPRAEVDLLLKVNRIVVENL